MKRRAAIAASVAAIVATLAASARAEEGWTGRYRVAEGPDIAGGLELRPDGRFAYFLIAGALDEQAQGTWRPDGDAARLTTSPKPRPPEFAPVPASAPNDAKPLRLLVTWPDGRGIAGVNFRIGFPTGEPIVGYTQEDGWTAGDDEVRQPAWVELSEPIHGTASPKFPVPSGQHALVYVLTPNDLGIPAFADARFMRHDDRFVLEHPRGGVLRLVREGR